MKCFDAKDAKYAKDAKKSAYAFLASFAYLASFASRKTSANEDLGCHPMAITYMASAT